MIVNRWLLGQTLTDVETTEEYAQQANALVRARRQHLLAEAQNVARYPEVIGACFGAGILSRWVKRPSVTSTGKSMNWLWTLLQ